MPSNTSTHIVIASDQDVDNLGEASKSGGFVDWIVPKKARPGDRLLFFHRGVGVLGEGVMATGPDKVEELPGKYSASGSRVVLYARPVPLEDILEAFPNWGWPTYPRGYTTVPEDVLGRLESMIEGHR